MAEIIVDGKTYEVGDGKNLLHACLSVGVDIPYFCWHPEMGSVGACRQCAVKQMKDENDERGRIVMSCMTPATDGGRFSVNDPEVKDFRRNVIEWLMVNHPHDCPICDEGGECHLQDMTVMTGHNYRRYRFLKRTHQNQDLGPFINHEMNRCITCYRCVRFYKEYAGGEDFDAFGSHDRMYFGRSEDGALESEFSGNLVEVCPTGVFTDKTLKRHYTRKWDLTSAPSVCQHCSLGCNTLAGERYGTLRRILNRYHRQVNAYFLCDRGRFGYEFVNHEARVREPLAQGEDGLTPVSTEQAVETVAPWISGGQAIGIGSPRASLESNFALRTLVGEDQFHLGFSERERDLVDTALSLLRAGPKTPSLEEIRRSDAALVLGEDVTNTAPLMALALRQTIRQAPLRMADELRIPRWQDQAVRELLQDDRGPLYTTSLATTKLDGVARGSWHGPSSEQARLGFAIAHELDPKSPEVPGLGKEMGELAERIAADLKAAERPVVVSGTGSSSMEVMQAAAAVARALENATLSLVLPEADSMGLALLGGGRLSEAVAAVKSGEAKTVVVLENDLTLRAGAEEVDVLLSAEHVVVLDHTLTETAKRAGVVLPAASFAESEGTLVSQEGRAQRFFTVFAPQGEIRSAFRWLAAAAGKAGLGARSFEHVDGVQKALARANPTFSAVPDITPPPDFRMVGQRVPRESARFSGRTAMKANVSVHEKPPPEDEDAPLTYSMEGTGLRPPPSLIPFYWRPGWNSAQAVDQFQQEMGGPLRGGDPGARLVEPAEGGRAGKQGAVPEAFSPRNGELGVHAVHHVFGDEELSRRSPAVAVRAPKAYLSVHPEDAGGREEGAEVGLEIGGRTLTVSLRFDSSLARGTAGLAAGLLGSGYVELPAFGRLSR